MSKENSNTIPEFAANETAKIVGDFLFIRLPLQAPAPSASGKTLVVASTRGNQETTAQVAGKPVILGVNAYIRR